MSVPKNLYSEKGYHDEEILGGSCAARVVILIDIAEFPASAESDKRANLASQSCSAASSAGAAATTVGVLDSLRLGVLRVITHLCLSCPKNSWVEWAPRFFDSRQGGVGKTPAELKARLRTRQVAHSVRGFRRVTQDSFKAFGDTCLAIACGIQGDPLARDRDTALRRWAHGQKKPPTKWTQPQHGAPSAAVGASAAPTDEDDSREDISMRMYNGHDMSSHEVVVRSLLEVLQDFDDASDGDRATAPSLARGTSRGDKRKLQLLLLHSPFPRTGDDAERFVLRGNFTPGAASINNTERPDDRASALDGLLNAHLGKAILRAGSRGVSFMWQEGCGTRDIGSRRAKCVDTTMSCLRRCLSAAGAGTLPWGRVVGSSGLLPPSAALRKGFVQASGQSHTTGVGGGGELREGYRRRVVVPFSLNRQGDFDVNLVASPTSGAVDLRRSASYHVAGSVSSAAAVGTASYATPWRLMGTVPMSELWPSCLERQGWGATRILWAERGPGVQLWREFLGELWAAEKAGVVTFPRRVFNRDDLPRSIVSPEETHLSEGLAVTVLVPVSGECAICFRASKMTVTQAPEREMGPESLECGERSPPEQREPAPGGVLLPSADEVGGKGVSCGGQPPTAQPSGSLLRAEVVLKRRRAEVGLAIQEASLARKRRRKAKGLPVRGARGINVPGPAIGGLSVEDRGVGPGGGNSGTLSQRGSGSLCFTAEGMSGDGTAYDVRQWRLEMGSVTSHGSDSVRGCRLFQSTLGDDDDERMSSSGSGSGPKRALYQALEEVSSRSSSLGPEAESSTMPEGSLDGELSNEAVLGGLDRDTTISKSRAQSPKVDDPAGVRAGLWDAGDTATGDLPLSLMCEPALACLPGGALPVGLISLAERCARTNRSAAAKAAASAAGDTFYRTGGGTQSHAADTHRTGVRQKFVEALRSLERRKQAAAPVSTVPPTADIDIVVEGIPSAAGVSEAPEPPDQSSATEVEASAGGRGDTEGLNQVDAADALDEGASSFEDGLSRGVAGLKMQYREIVEGGRRSPVEFVVRVVPEAIRGMTAGGKETLDVGQPSDDRHARAAQVLAAVVNGLTSTPKELSSKHRANRSAGTPGTGASSGAGTSTAKPALQKIRDYQLQALLLCQLNILGMDLPESSESLVAFSCLAAADEIEKKKKKKGKAKGKGKKRRREGNSADQSAVVASTRPLDPLSDCRRTRLVDYLQPISTMLDACTVTKPPPLDDGLNLGSGEVGGKAAKGFQSRAYDGTLADFMGLALVEHFAARLPRTIGLLFEDFECHPPDTLTAALAGTQTSADGATADGGVAMGNAEGGGGPSVPNDPDAAMGAASNATSDRKAVGAAGSAPKSERGDVGWNGHSTAGILLSDRTAMSHNHFKMSGVLNGFREVKIKGQAAPAGGLRPTTLGKVSGNDKVGRDTPGGSGDNGDSGGWRKSSLGRGGESRRAPRSRPTRDAKQAGATGKTQKPSAAKPPPAPGTRRSPRRGRKRPGGDADTAWGVLSAVPKKQRSLPDGNVELPFAASVSAGVSDAVKPRHTRRAEASPRSGSVRRARTGVLVSETPRKRMGGSASRSRCGGGREAPASGSTNPVATNSASPAVSGVAAPHKALVPAEAHIPASPSFPMGAPSPSSATGSRKQCPGMAAGPASPNESLFVAESPGVSGGSLCRGGRVNWAADVDIDSVSRQLMTESVGPAAADDGRGAMVPGTPA